MTPTDWIWLSIVATAAVADVILIAVGEDTLTERWRFYGKTRPILWFFGGFVVGHLVW